MCNCIKTTHTHIVGLHAPSSQLDSLITFRLQEPVIISFSIWLKPDFNPVNNPWPQRAFGVCYAAWIQARSDESQSWATSQAHVLFFPQGWTASRCVWWTTTGTASLLSVHIHSLKVKCVSVGAVHLRFSHLRSARTAPDREQVQKPLYYTHTDGFTCCFCVLQEQIIHNASYCHHIITLMLHWTHAIFFIQKAQKEMLVWISTGVDKKKCLCVCKRNRLALKLFIEYLLNLVCDTQTVWVLNASEFSYYFNE